MKLRIRAFGLALGIVVGVVFLAAILFSLFFGAGVTFAQIRPLFGMWVDRTVVGAFIGLFWGFVYGFVIGALLAWLYNTMCKALYKQEGTK